MFQICLVVSIFILDPPKQENCLCLNSLGNITLKHLDIQQVSQQNSNCFYLAITQFFVGIMETMFILFNQILLVAI